MAEKFFNSFQKDDKYIGKSAGTTPTKEIHQVVKKAMLEIKLDMKGQTPKVVSDEDLKSCYKLVNMGCLKCGSFSQYEKKMIKWNLKDPKGSTIKETRIIRDEIQSNIKSLIKDLWRDHDK